MTLTVVVPAKDLDDLGSPLRLEDLQPPTSVPSAVRPVCAPPENTRHAQTVHSVSATRRSKRGDEKKEGPTDEVLVEREGRLGAVVSEKARADGGHVRFSLCNQRAANCQLTCTSRGANISPEEGKRRTEATNSRSSGLPVEGPSISQALFHANKQSTTGSSTIDLGGRKNAGAK